MDVSEGEKNKSQNEVEFFGCFFANDAKQTVAGVLEIIP